MRRWPSQAERFDMDTTGQQPPPRPRAQPDLYKAGGYRRVGRKNMDSVGSRKEVSGTTELPTGRRRGARGARGRAWPWLAVKVNCNCDAKRTRGRRRRADEGEEEEEEEKMKERKKKKVARVSAPTGNCPKLYLSLGVLCLVGASFQAAALAASPEANQTLRKSDCLLPFIGALFGAHCADQQTEPTTAAASSQDVAMRYESLKVNQSGQQWSGQPQPPTQLGQQQQQVREAAVSLSAGPAAASELSSSEGAPAKPQQQQQQQQLQARGPEQQPRQTERALSVANLNVLCNSRCNCVILDLSSQPARQLVTPDTGKQPAQAQAQAQAQASAGALVAAAFGSGDQAPAPGSGSSSSGGGADQANQALIAFNEDYSLDYEQPQAEPQILSASSNPSNYAHQQQQQQQQQTRGDQARASQSSTPTRQPQLQPRESGQQQQQQHQLSPPIAANNNQPLQVFPLHHHAGNGGGNSNSGPNKANSAQLYAQSLYSSQAPKLSYHAHAPHHYQTNQLPPAPAASNLQQPSSSASASASGANLYLSSSSSQNPQSGGISAPAVLSSGELAVAPSSGSQTNYHHFLHHNPLRQHLRHHSQQASSLQASTRQQEELDEFDQFAAVGGGLRLQLRALLPLRRLNASHSASIRQPDASTLDHSSEMLAPESLLTELEQLMAKIDTDQIQSLNLSGNEIEFEYWQELYALLAVQFRRNLYHLDLSHNSIAKLGITFSGYLEHYLVAHDGLWQQQPQSAQSTNPKPQQQQQQHDTAVSQNEINSPKAPTNSNQPAQKSRSGTTNRLNSLFNGGKLYSLVRNRLASSNKTSGLLVLSPGLNGSNSSSQQTKQLLGQPMLIRALDLSHNKLKWLINDQFKALKHVQAIRLDHNRIRYIHQHAFSGLESLRFLNLNYNRLQVIYIEQFQTNYNLLALMLRANNLAYVRGGSFSSLSQLKRLDLSQNKLTILSNNAFIGLESLELLNCSSNQFAHLPSGSFHPLTSLKRLDLSNNLITELAPGTFFHLPVEELWLNENDQLVRIERGALWDLPYLRRLHLSSNPMLASINSQSFVSTQNLQFIHTDDCQSLDSTARQLLENITMAATSRQLRQLESMSAPATAATTTTTSIAAPSSAEATTIKATLELATNLTGGPLLVPQSLSATIQENSTSAAAAAAIAAPIAGAPHKAAGAQQLAKQQLQQHQQQSNNLTKHLLYYAASMSLLIVALMLVFKYTASSRYLEARRRRRRVYELDSAGRKYSASSADCSGSQSSSSSSLSDCDSWQQQQHRLDSSSRPGHQFELLESANNVILEQQSLAGIQTSDHRPEEREEEEEEEEEGLNISVINVSPPAAANPSCCPDCERLPQLALDEQPIGDQCQCPEQQQQQQPPPQVNSGSDQQPSIDLIRSQLIAAGFDYGHANCAHFYQSLGPALQLADMTANFVNGIDFY